MSIMGLIRQLERFTPWQIILSSLTAVYTMRNFDMILGLSGTLSHLCQIPVHPQR